MKLVLRWFPYGDDSVTLKQIKQIPCVSGVATHLTRIPVGDIWTMDEINLVKDELYDEFIAHAKKEFNERYGHEPIVIDVIISDGARRVEE